MCVTFLARLHNLQNYMAFAFDFVLSHRNKRRNKGQVSSVRLNGLITRVTLPNIARSVHVVHL